MPELDAETKLTIDERVDERIGRLLRALLTFGAIIFAFTGVGLWQFLEQTGKHAVEEAKNQAVTAINYESRVMIDRIVETQATIKSATSRANDLLEHAEQTLGVAKERSRDLILISENMVENISGKETTINNAAMRIQSVEPLLDLSNRLQEVARVLANNSDFQSAVGSKVSPMPSGMIAAYYFEGRGDSSQMRCPEGWSQFADANGRVIVGAGRQRGTSRTWEFGSVGGKEKASLTTEQMPSHTHKVMDPGHTHVARAPDYMGENTGKAQGWPKNNIHYRFKSTDRGFGSPQAGNIRDYNIHESALGKANTGMVVADTGGDQQVDTMPPYIVMYICKKD